MCSLKSKIGIKAKTNVHSSLKERYRAHYILLHTLNICSQSLNYSELNKIES